MTPEDIKQIKNMTDEELKKQQQKLFAKKNLLKPYVDQYNAADCALSSIEDEVAFRHCNKNVRGKFFFNNADDRYIYVAECYYSHNNVSYGKCLIIERGETIEDSEMYYDNIFINSDCKEITKEVFMLQVAEILNNLLCNACISVTVTEEETNDEK